MSTTRLLKLTLCDITRVLRGNYKDDNQARLKIDAILHDLCKTADIDTPRAIIRRLHPRKPRVYKIGETVTVNYPNNPAWNGDGTITSIIDLRGSYQVRMLTGVRNGLVGGFNSKQLKLKKGIKVVKAK